MTKDLPSSARVVIIGGGVVGCSVAYHLAKAGCRDVLLLERKQLSSGTTWHAAGLVGQLRATLSMTRIAQYGAQLMPELERETGQATGYTVCGTVMVAATAGRLEELMRAAAAARGFGLDVQLFTPDEIRAKVPILDVSDLAGGLYLPTDGKTGPTETTLALAKGARQHGADIRENVKVTEILVAGGCVRGVVADGRRIDAEVVVNCAGMWGREIGLMAGAAVPLHACEHYYVVTDIVPDLPANLPTLRDQDGRIYVRPDGGRLLIGGFERRAKPWGQDGIPDDFSFTELPFDEEHFMPLIEHAMRRIPILERVGIRTFFNGPESFTPDNRYYLGETPETRNFFVACGFNSTGIQSGPGAGHVIASWILNGAPPFDVSDVDIRRIAAGQNGPRYLRQRVSESLGLLYDMHWPYRQFETARGLRRSPLHDRLALLGACFGEVATWERANWYAGPGTVPEYSYSYGRQNWFEAAAAEHKAVRSGVALFDLSSFAKLAVEGPDAAAFLQRVSANDIDVPVGRIIYTQWLNARGGIEADVTITRLSETRFLVVTGAANKTRDLAWLRRNLQEPERASITDVTSAYSVISVMGPRSRELLTAAAGPQFENGAFPFGRARMIELAMSEVLALRVTYVGELGWELYVPVEQAVGVFDHLYALGEPLGLRMAGYHTLDSCRVEKGYRHWGHDVADTDTPFEAGLGAFVRLSKNADFNGRDAALTLRDRPLTRRLASLHLLDPDPLLYHDEPIFLQGRIVGRVTSAAFGHTVGAATGLGYVEHQEVSQPGFFDEPFEIEVAGRRVNARLSLAPFYDPKSQRIRM